MLNKIVDDRYQVNFSEIDKCFNNEVTLREYYDRKIKKYTLFFKSGDKSTIMQYDVRMKRSIKAMLHSATFYYESKKALENGLFGSYFFSLYYSLFHAIYGVLFLDINHTFERLEVINHTKLYNCFKNEYCKNKNRVINNDIEVFELLKFLREYYSYSMPMNDFFLGDDSVSKKLESIESLLINCYQLTNFLSTIIEQSACGANRASTNLADDIQEYRKLYLAMNGKKNPYDNEIYLDSADENYFADAKKYGIRLNRISILLNHYFDELGGYSDNIDNKKFYDKHLEVSTMGYGLVWKSIF